MNSKPNLAVLTGGDSLEAVSSYTSAANVYDSLEQNKFNRYLVELKSGKWRLMKGDDLTEDECGLYKFNYQNCSFTGSLQNNSISFDVVIPIIHGRPAETGQLQGYLDIVGMPYTGSGVMASAIAMSKKTCKRILSESLEVSMPADLVFETLQDTEIKRIEQELGFPVIIKPEAEGSGLGVALVHNQKELLAALSDLQILPGKVLVERYISGKEVTIGAVRSPAGWYCPSIAEVERPEHTPNNSGMQKMRSYKSRQNAQLIIPAHLPEPLNLKLKNMTVSIGEILGLQHYFRVDFIIDSNNIAYFLEVNSIPGFSSKSVFTQQLLMSGLKLENVWSHIIEDVLRIND